MQDKRRGSVNCFREEQFREFSRILEDVVSQIVKSEKYDVMYQEIFIDINNNLYEVFLKKQHLETPIYFLLKFFSDKIKILLTHINTPDVFQNFCIQFEFLNHDLKALFPNGKFHKDIPLCCTEAEDWWKSNFGDNIFLEAEEFWTCFSTKFPALDDINCVIKSICFTQFDFFGCINKHSFNLFLLYYGGWTNLDKLWFQIYHHPAHAYMTTVENCMNEIVNVRNRLGPLRSLEKSYWFCIDWKSTEGLWNLISINDQDIQEELVKPTTLIDKLKDTKRYLYPKGSEQPTNKTFTCNSNDNSIDNSSSGPYCTIQGTIKPDGDTSNVLDLLSVPKDSMANQKQNL